MIIYTQMKGSSFRPAESREVYNHLPNGTKLRLERDRENKYDANAVKVIAKANNEDHFIAYVAKEEAIQVALCLDAGLSYRCEVVQRPQLEIEFFTESDSTVLDDEGNEVLDERPRLLDESDKGDYYDGDDD